LASPQKENGFVAIANELFEAICMAGFTSRQYAVILAVIRKTYGWGRKYAPVSVREISRMTGIRFSHVTETIKELIEKRVLTDYGVHGQTRILGVNKCYDEWTGVPKTGTGVFPKQERNSSQNGNTSVPETGTHTIKKQLKQGERKHSPEFLAIWELYPAKKRRGLDFVTEEDERAVLANAEAVRGAISQYLRETDETYICKAETFFRETWKAYTEPAGEQTKSKFGRTLE
jgi:phage replication O-like protein O